MEVQGATNVALATLEGMRLAAQLKTENLLEEVETVGYSLSHTRDNEPLARNAVRFVLSSIKGNNVLAEILSSIEEFKVILDQAKSKIKEYAVEELDQYEVILTHCHSSTSTQALIALARRKPSLKIVATETRPLYQGRRTAKELVKAGVDVTMIVDSASASFIVDDRYLPVGAVVIGCDEIHKGGAVVNKVGSYQIALAAKQGNDKLYVLTTLLKLDPKTQEALPSIEMRPAREVWEQAPEDLNIINPAFEIIPAKLVTGYITEAGVLSANELEKALYEKYSWTD